MSLIRRFNLGRRFCNAMPRRAEDIMSNPDCRAMQICLRVSYLIGSGGDLDTAVKYARLAVFTDIKSEFTATLAGEVIMEGMLRNKRHKDAYDLYDFFFIQHKLRPNRQCCNHMIESCFQQGLVDEALDFHHRCINSGQVQYYPSDETFKVLTKGLVNSGRVDQAEALLRGDRPDRTVGRRFIFPDHVAFKNLIRGFLDLGNLDKANQLLDEFKRFIYTALSGTKDDDWMLCRSEYENIMAFLMATFVEYWFKKGKEVKAMECYNGCVLANRLQVRSETGNAFLVILLKYGKKKHAWDLYHDMLSTSKDDTFTTMIIVDECFKTGLFSEAMENYNKLRAANNVYFIGRFTRQTGRFIISRCCENGMLSEAQTVFNRCLVSAEYGQPDFATFKTMIDAYLDDGRKDDAIKASNQMITATLKGVSSLF